MNQLAPGSATTLRPGPRGGRRQVTIVFVDLVGSTALSQRLDPEEYEELLNRYRQLCEDRVVSLGGHVEQFQGDGVLCCFGYPAAHEDDAVRSVRAGLEIVAEVARLSHAGAAGPLQARVGIATGLSVVDMPSSGSMPGLKVAVGGETPNIAARLQSIAPTGGVVIGESTRRLVGGLFELAGLGSHELKGLNAPQTVWQVLRERQVGSRFEARSQRPVPVVGRDPDMAVLLGLWRSAVHGTGRTVVVTGDAGVGKSHLLQELSLRPDARPNRFVVLQCSPDYENTAFWPFVKRLDDELGGIDLARSDKLVRLRTFLAGNGIGDADALPLIGQLLSLEVPAELVDNLGYSPEKRRDRTAEILMRLAIGDGERPALILLEDMHWADPSTIELAGRLADRIGSARALLAISSRSDVEAMAARGAVRIALEPLDADATAALIRALASGRRLPEEIVQSIRAKTDGVPLFVEELTRSVLESGLLREVGDVYEVSDEFGAMAIPMTLQDSLTARLDHLGPVREIAQVGAAIGREFSYELLAAVVPVPAEALDAALERLVASGLVAPAGSGPGQRYVFRHALIQDAAYESMLKSTRQQLHGRLATALAAHWPATAETQPETLARHLMHAGRAGEAAPLWLRAGQNAQIRSALAEAIAHFTTALALVARLPAGAERDDLELAIRVGLGGAYIAQRGWASDRVRSTVGPARVLATRTRNARYLSTTMFQVWVNFHTRCEFPSALEVAEELIAQGHQRQEPSLLAHGHGMAAQTLYFVGRFSEALERLRLCRELADFERDMDVVINTNHEVRASSEARVGSAHWILGYPERGRASAEDAVAYARRTGHPFNLAFVLAVSSHTYLYRGDVGTALAQINEARRVASDQRLASLEHMTLPLYEGRMLLLHGRPEEGLRVATSPLDVIRRVGQQRTTISTNLVMLGRLLAGTGEVQAGLVQIQAGLDLADETGDVFEVADLWRLKGETLLLVEREADAEACFRRAIAIARQQNARGWELRAATSLAHLLHAGGDAAAGAALLRPLYETFDEGLDTTDLVRARSVLDRLAQGR